MLEHIVQERADINVMTGDLTSLAFEFEFNRVDSILSRAGLDCKNTIIIPGNHDRYAISADLGDAFERAMTRWLPKGFIRDRGYPIVQTAGPVALIALDTAVWRNPARAAGYIARDQVERLEDILDSDEISGQWPVIAMHHPPFHLCQARFRDYRNGLDGLEDLMRILERRAATMLHGHLHRVSRRSIGKLDVIGVPAASNNTGEETTQLAYHVYTFERSGLVHAEAVRHWSDRSDEEMRFERLELPNEAHAD